MEDLTGRSWRRRGSSVICCDEMLRDLIATASAISLRSALAWKLKPPKTPPEGKNTVVIYGLQACLETLPLHDAEDFLRHQVHPLILSVQQRWDACGLVFALPAKWERFRVAPAQDAVYFKTVGADEVNLSKGLWGGSAALYLRRLVREDEKGKAARSIGFYAQRIS